jgi:hypothetical protein
MLHLRSFNRFILTCMALSVLGISPANAALVTGFVGLDIDGT